MPDMDSSIQRPRLADALAQLLGRDPHPSAGGQMIWKSRSGEHLFEWHPKTRRVYLIREHASPVVGEVIAFDIETHGDAINAINIWRRGFAEGRTPDVAKSHLQL